MKDLLEECLVNLDEVNYNCLCDCIRYENIPMLDLLVDFGLDLHSEGSIYTKNSLGRTLTQNWALWFACVRSSYKMVKYLLDHGFDPNADNGECFLGCFDWSPNTKPIYELVKLMLEHGADPNTGNGLALRIVLENPNVEVIRLLISFGADPTLVRPKTKLIDNKFTLVDFLLDVGFDAKQLAEIYTERKID
jgi:ankyrin repeat protein